MTKYRAKPVHINGIRFASTKEGKRYSELKLLERSGQIRNLELQPGFPIVFNGKYIGRYSADFSYLESGQRIIEDVKGFKTPLYRFKKKCIEALYGVEIKET